MSKKIGDDKLFHFINYTFLTMAFLLVLYPLINILSQSISTPQAVIGGRVYLLPVGFDLNGYKWVLKDENIIRGFLNSLLYTTTGTFLNIVMTVMAAYPLSRKELYGRNVITFYFIFTMLFGGGMIPTYLVVRSLGLIDTRLVMILPSALAVWNVMIARNFFQTTIPNELQESAVIDGASDIRVLVSIVLPLSIPIIAVLVMFYAVGHWNDYFTGLLYLRSSELFNFQIVLRNSLSSVGTLRGMIDTTSEMERLEMLIERMKYVVIIVGILPMMILYPFVQRYFIKGIVIGALKG
jgi:putative aldouronate transport system permease protein